MKKLLPVTVAAILASAIAASAANTTFFTGLGDIAFPLAPPNQSTGAPGTLDNTDVGDTTPAAGHFTTVTSTTGESPAAVTGSASPFPIAGKAGPQGGAVSVTGGASSTSADAGGAASLVGGAAGATGVGGAASLVGGAGGSTSGAGGAVNLTAGATTTSGAGGAITLTAGAGAGGTNAGGSVNLVPGAAVSTGVPGEVKFNGDSAVSCATYFQFGTPAATTQVFFVATRTMRVKEVGAIWSAAAGGTSTIGVTHDTSTNAPGAGTDVLGTDININGTANTYAGATLVATVATLTLAPGDRLAVKWADAIQSTAGLVVTACMAPD